VATNTYTQLTLSSSWAPNQPTTGKPYTLSTISYTATTLSDLSKNWIPGQWIGYAVTVTSGGSPETGVVATNTTNMLTMKAAWAVPHSGATDPYAISTVAYGVSTVVDTNKNWSTNQWAGDVVSVSPSSTNVPETDTVNSNTATTLIMNSNWGTPPSSGDAYVVARTGYTATTLVDPFKSWATNAWAGAGVTVTLSNSAVVTGTVASNTASTLTLQMPWTTLPSGGNAFVVSSITYTSTTVKDVSKSWPVNQWTGSIVTVTLSNNATESATVASNTSNTLVITAPWLTIPDPGNSYAVNTAVVLYLACPTSPPYWSCGVGGQSGGTISVTGKGTFGLTAATSGPYAGIAVFTDPNLIDPSGGNVLNIAGNGGTFGGTIYAPRGSAILTGGGSSGTGVSVAGRMIMRAINITGNGSSVLSFTGSVPSSTVTACYYYNDNLTGTEVAGGSSSLNGDVQFETTCDSGGLNGQGATASTSIISFDYRNGP
jgi:hypothetical protein